MPQVIVGIDARYGLRRQRRGIGNYVFNLILELQRSAPDDWEFILYGDSQADPLVSSMLQADRVRVTTLWAPNPALWEQVVLPLAARRDNVDLLHCTSNIAPVIVKPSRIVTTIHDVIEYKRRLFDHNRLTLRYQLSRLYRMMFMKWVVRRSDYIITVSEFSKIDAISTLKVSPNRITTIFEAAPKRPATVSLVPPEQVLLELGITRPYILAMGAIDPRKNTRRLLEAYALVKNRETNPPQLVIVGVERPELFRDNAPAGVVILGFQPDVILSLLYRHALFFVYPSIYEGFGLPVLEAMEHGVAVACSGSTALAETAGDAALFFDPMNCDDIADKIERLIHDTELRAALALKGKQWAARFTWEQCARDTLAVYQRVLDGQHHERCSHT